ncbi:MAG: glycosyltransferase [Akkermansiaceae bacterium]|jgi:rhamnopyranosyl-N-acetylglucosaminyl-diphospho-decaprenol beta-1,3/1,4-galactofuranosyltransferase|nr:glycosyltransferase [Akkermansiaceae bacterium]MDP4645709.1 glycosyltransferase [Akkermansiaceae bacterium]MDP4721646.1 glycosyltransferase [Akkermansiaceae bacterium]
MENTKNGELVIAAVFATMNRSSTAVSCVKSLAAQTHPPDHVIVADNVSTDSTFRDLHALRELPFELTVIPMPENAGNAGGVKEAMELAFEKGADAVWILDDDSWPRPDALEAMLKDGFDQDVVSHPIQIDPLTKKFTWPLQVLKNGEWILATTKEELPAGEKAVSRGVWTGALVSRRIRETIGPVMAELFIRGEDEEYPWRMAEAGFSHAVYRDAVLDHPGPTSIIALSCFGKSFFFERGLADWKFYYKTRNMVWLKRKQSGKCKALLTGLAYSLAGLLSEGPSRLPLAWAAAKAGWKGELGRMPKNLV